jgi:excisionase family DNA binding protein
MEPITCSVQDAARALSVSRATIYNWMRENRIETARVGGRRLVKIASVRRLIEVA